jgi:hypothetical protein
MNIPSPGRAEIRKMQLSDLDHIILIEREIFLFPWSLGNFADSIKTGYVCRVLQQTDTLMGYGIMMMSPEEAHILTLGIAANWQKKAWGKKCCNSSFSMPKNKMQNRFSWTCANPIKAPHSSINKWVFSISPHAKAIIPPCADAKMRLSCG